MVTRAPNVGSASTGTGERTERDRVRIGARVGWCNRLNGIFSKDYHFLAIGESNRARAAERWRRGGGGERAGWLYITGIPDPQHSRPRQDLRSSLVSFVPRGRKDEKLADPVSSPEGVRRGSHGSSGPIINLPNRISSASGRLEKVDTSVAARFFRVRAFFYVDGCYEPGGVHPPLNRFPASSSSSSLA